MKVSETLTGAVEDFLENMPDTTAHIENTENPHCVTKEQVGLENVINERQITEDDLSDHADGTMYRHSAEDIDYSESFTVKEKIEDLIITGGGGTMYHDELENRDSADSHPMSAITGLEDAISDIEGKFDEVIVFEGTTTDDTSTELTSTQTSDYVNQYGRLTMPVGCAAVLDVLAVSAEVSDGAISNSGGCCITRFDVYTARVGGTTLFESKAFENTGMDRNVTLTAVSTTFDATSITFEKGTSIKIKVTGLADTTLCWRVEVRIRKAMDVS